MPVSYHIYSNDGQGGDVEYATPIATSAAPTYGVGPLAAPSDTTFAVRAFDVISGIEEANTDARVRIIIDAAGNDVTARPNAVRGLSAAATAGGNCLVTWSYAASGQGGPPARFDVYQGASGLPQPPAPAASVGYLPGQAGYSCSLSGLPAGPTATITVEAVGPAPWLIGPAAAVTVRSLIVPLSDVDALTASPTP